MRLSIRAGGAWHVGVGVRPGHQVSQCRPSPETDLGSPLDFDFQQDLSSLCPTVKGSGSHGLGFWVQGFLFRVSG